MWPDLQSSKDNQSLWIVRIITRALEMLQFYGFNSILVQVPTEKNTIVY